MALPTIITLADIRAVRPVSASLDPDYIDPYIVEAQEQELKPLLGNAFFLEFVNNIDGGTPSTENELLFDGGEYASGNETFTFRGVNEFLSYASYARLAIRQNSLVTRFGVVTKETEESLPVNTAAFNQERYDARAVQMGIQKEITNFLNSSSQSANYPLWRKRETSPTKQGFRFSKVPRNIRP